MISRYWRGWTTLANADAYEQLLRTEVLPGFHRIKGYKGAYLLRRDLEHEVEFATITFFDTMDDVRDFAGERYETAVVPPAARKLLSHFDETSLHYDTLLKPA
ncbi:antibiotic biosynthesis monooxygenase [Ktedonosporobacter rubrisoli]|uniref:Antibiotic biosynthesis monooxygenase n=1 Tax=Ktedonosporobacter rubrisoli TaxID=2509675 RepID=A0A4P6JNI9_KTERU|nr:antibiotic biosynthesis monooxygenase [Ktedonosporobacter rubrisoli]QBD76805.1 antibiotic biosynthesis monooxygenase [Ktedonosporobacter rubrisoli]